MNWKTRVLPLFIASAALAPTSHGLACAWDDSWGSDFYRFYEPEFSHLQEFKPFHFTFDRLYDYALLEDSTSQAANLKAWQQYLGPGIKRNDIEAVVYKLSADELVQIKSQPNGSVATGYASNGLVAEWRTGKRLDVLHYLILAHQAEPYCFYDDPWSDPPRDTKGIESVIETAKSGSKSSTDPFLKLRYAYQAVRLQQYAGMHVEATETYRQLAQPNLKGDPLIAQWAMCHYAGCLRALDMEAEAAYTFSRVFDQCPSRRIHAWYGWRILSDDIWEAVQAKCKDNHEMATVFFLRGYASEADPMEDMRQIHELDPGSKLLDVLLLREINKLENDLLGYPFTADKPLSKRLNSGMANDLQSFVEEVMAGGRMHDRNVWQLAHVYLHFLKGDIARATAELGEKQAQLSAEGQLKARVMNLIFHIASLQKVDRSVENTIFKDFTNLSAKIPQEEADELGKFRDDAFAWLYEAQGEPAKALLARGQGWQLAETPIHLDVVNDMIAFDAKDDKTLYEKELLSRMGDEKTRKDWLLEIKGTALLAKNLVPEAIRVFQQISEAYRANSPSFQLRADPFRVVTTDVVNCEDCGAGKYSKLSFAEAIMDLQKKLMSEPAKTVEYNMLLGNAYYNTTYFGAAWNAKDFQRSGGSWGYLGVQSDWYQFNRDTFEEIVDMSLAKDYYMKALKASKDKEMAALAAFMVAKCELNQFYLDGMESMNNYYTGFQQLKENYRKTNVFKDLINECWYLQSYVGN